MTPHSLVLQIHAALGHSVLYEENKDDFKQSRQLAERYLAEARQAGNTPLVVDALLELGVVKMLQCECSAALACFEECDRLSADDPAALLHSTVYATWTTINQYNLFPHG